MRCRSYLATLEAGQLFKASIVRDDQQRVLAQVKATEAGILDALIDEIQTIANSPELMIKLLVNTEQSIEQQAPTEPSE